MGQITAPILHVKHTIDVNVTSIASFKLFRGNTQMTKQSRAQQMATSYPALLQRAGVKVVVSKPKASSTIQQAEIVDWWQICIAQIIQNKKE